jgi:hypothetical protein
MQRLKHLANVRAAGNHIFRLRFFLNLRADLVVFVPNLTHKLLQNILQRDDACRSAVLVQNDRDMHLPALQLL